MEWRDEGVVVGLRKHGETSVILDLLTIDHGRHLGVVRGGRSRRLRAVLQPGNALVATWRARLDDHLGTFVVEPLALRAGTLMEDARALHGLNYACALARLLAEREPHPGLHATLSALLGALGAPGGGPEAIVRFEIGLLADLGFGLDLDTCAVSGISDDLAYVSPRTGRAVSRAAGEAYRDRVLPLPAFIRSPLPDAGPALEDIAAAFTLTEHFLRRDLFEPRGLPLPDSRRFYLAAVLGAAADPAAQTGRSAVLVTP